MKANFGLLPPLDVHIRKKHERHQAYADRSIRDLEIFLQEINEI